MPRSMPLNDIKSAPLKGFTRNGQWHSANKIHANEDNDILEISTLKTLPIREISESEQPKLHTRDIKISRTPSHSFVRSKIWFQNTNAEVDTIIWKCFACQAMGQRVILKRANFLPNRQNYSMQNSVVLFINEYSRYTVLEIFKVSQQMQLYQC